MKNAMHSESSMLLMNGSFLHVKQIMSSPTLKIVSKASLIRDDLNH
jgi:hypothetical protein